MVGQGPKQGVARRGGVATQAVKRGASVETKMRQRGARLPSVVMVRRPMPPAP